MTGIVGLPYGFIASTFITLGSGTPYTIDDQSLGGGVNQRVLQRNGGRPEQFDVHHSRRLGLSQRRPAAGEGLPLRRHARGVGDLPGLQHLQLRQLLRLQGFIPTLPATNPNFGRPSSLIDPGRRLQFGLRYGF